MKALNDYKSFLVNDNFLYNLPLEGQGFVFLVIRVDNI